MASHIEREVGRLLERTEWHGRQLQDQNRKTRMLERRVAKLERGGAALGPWEKWIKRILTVTVPAWTLYATGSLEKSIHALGLVLKLHF
jgi:hypothetical protein